MLLNISTWWQQLENFEKILWGITLLFSLFYILQSTLSLSGGDADTTDGDADGAVEHDEGMGYQFFTIKNMIAFFTIFGWVGLAAHYSGLSKTITLLLAFVSGVLVVLMMFLILKNMSRLRYNGLMQISNAINQTGTTYLFIPASRGGVGKVHVKVQGTLQELPAMTDDEIAIATGKLIKVKNVINDRILLVTLAENSLLYKV